MASGAKRTQAERRAGTRLALLDATVDAVVAKGYAGATVAEICKHAGCSQGALFNHFTSKADLLGAAVEYVFPILIDEFAHRAAALVPAQPVADLSVDVLTVRLRRVLGLLWEAYEQPRLQAALELYMAARTDRELGVRLAAVDGPHRRRLTALGAVMFPEVADLPGFDTTVDIAIDAIQGFAVANLALTTVDGRRGGRDPEPFLDQLTAVVAASMLASAPAPLEEPAR
jgi:AcrR family transcriptional regulator